MTDIDKLEAGRELDALVAEHIFGWKRIAEGSVSINVPSGETVLLNDLFVSPDDYERVMVRGLALVAPMNLPDFSTDISAAWEVVEHVRRMHPARVWFELYAPRGDLPWTAVFFTRCLEWEDSMYEMGSDRIIPSSGKEAPLAICRAALKAVGVK